jgi:DNA-binding NarL/FixJ family response regulator
MKERTPQTTQDIYLVSDDTRLRRQLSSALEECSIYRPPTNVSAENLLDMMPTIQSALVVVDLSFQDNGGFSLIRQLTGYQSSPLILAVSPDRLDRAAYARRALIAGATGYLSEEEIPEKFVRAIRRMTAGNIFLSDRTKERLHPPTAVET